MAGGGRRNWNEAAQGLKPAAVMVLIQVVFAGVNVLYKLALNDGMDVRVIVAYRYLFAFAFIGPLAFFVERKQRPKLTWRVLGLAFLCGLFGAVLGQNLYVSAMKLTSATFVSAMTNLSPAITFILAVSFRLERLNLGTNYGQAKVIGTLLGLGGAMLLTFYRGVDLKLWSTHIDLMGRADADGGQSPSAAAAAAVALHGHGRSEHGKSVVGSFLAVASCLCYALWLIIQAKMAQVYPFHCSSAALMCFMASVQATLFAVCVERRRLQWRLGFDIRLLTAACAGVFASGMTFTLLGWCIKKKGPLYASVFSPLVLVLVAILSSILLDEKLYLGCLLGAAMIVSGLYIVLWGKGVEASKIRTERSGAGGGSSQSIEVVIVKESTAADGNVAEPSILWKDRDEGAVEEDSARLRTIL